VTGEKESASCNYSSAALFKVEISVEKSRRSGIIFFWTVGWWGWVVLVLKSNPVL